MIFTEICFCLSELKKNVRKGLRNLQMFELKFFFLKSKFSYQEKLFFYWSRCSSMNHIDNICSSLFIPRILIYSSIWTDKISFSWQRNVICSIDLIQVRKESLMSSKCAIGVFFESIICYKRREIINKQYKKKHETMIFCTLVVHLARKEIKRMIIIMRFVGILSIDKEISHKIDLIKILVMNLFVMMDHLDVVQVKVVRKTDVELFQLK